MYSINWAALSNFFISLPSVFFTVSLLYHVITYTSIRGKDKIYNKFNYIFIQNAKIKAKRKPATRAGFALVSADMAGVFSCTNMPGLSTEWARLLCCEQDVRMTMQLRKQSTGLFAGRVAVCHSCSRLFLEKRLGEKIDDGAFARCDGRPKAPPLESAIF